MAHECEFTKFDARRGYLIAKKMKDNQIRRREAKNLKEQIEPLVDLLNKHQAFFKELKNVHAGIELTRGIQNKRTYTHRTDIMQIAK